MLCILPKLKPEHLIWIIYYLYLHVHITGTPYNVPCTLPIHLLDKTNAFAKERESIHIHQYTYCSCVVEGDTLTARSRHAFCSILGVMTSILKTQTTVVWYGQNYCFREGKRHSMGKCIHTHPLFILSLCCRRIFLLPDLGMHVTVFLEGWTPERLLCEMFEK